MWTIFFYSLLIAMYSIISIFWLVFNTKDIFNCKKYQKGLIRSITDEESSYINKQYYYHYQTTIRKNIFLILINLCEVMGVYAMYIKTTLLYYYLPNHANYSLVESEFEYCNQVNNSQIFYFQFSHSSYPVLNALEALGDCFDFITFALLGYLMLYLMKRMKRISFCIASLQQRIILVSSFIMPLIIVTSACITSLLLVSVTLFLLTLPIAYYNFLQIVKDFSYSLLQRANERLAQHRSNANELMQYKYFKWTISPIASAFFIILLAIFLMKLPQLLTGILFYGKCYFPLNLFPNYRPIYLSNIQIEEYLNFMRGTIVFCEILACIGISLILLPLFIVTFSYWIVSIYNIISSKKKIKYRYKVGSSNTPLIRQTG